MSSAVDGPEAAAQAERLRDCQTLLGHTFRDQRLLTAALTHASGANHRLASNERLEFLGDAILGFVVCDLLYERYPEYLEGELTRIKSIVVSRETCAGVSQRLGLERFLIVGKGMASADGFPPSLLADVFESLVAALFLDGGMAAARGFIEEHIGPLIGEAEAGDSGTNHKSLLQQYSQRVSGDTPTYPLLEEQGPDHNKCFRVAAMVGGRRFPSAWGRNKKEAEQRAAANALAVLQEQEPPFAETEPE